MKKLILILFMILCVLPFINAVVYEQSTDFNLTVICTNNGTYCSASALCNGTLINPEGVAVINNEPMTRIGAVYSLSVNSTHSSTNGEYQLNSVCIDGSLAKSESWFFNITPNGELPTITTSILYIGLVSFLIIFLGFLIFGFVKYESLLARFMLFHFFYLILMSTMFIMWNISANYFMGVTFLTSFFRIIWWVMIVGFFPLILSSFVWVGYKMITIKEITDMMERGIPMEEASARKSGGRF